MQRSCRRACARRSLRSPDSQRARHFLHGGIQRSWLSLRSRRIRLLTRKVGQERTTTHHSADPRSAADGVLLLAPSRHHGGDHRPSVPHHPQGERRAQPVRYHRTSRPLPGFPWRSGLRRRGDGESRLPFFLSVSCVAWIVQGMQTTCHGKPPLRYKRESRPDPFTKNGSDECSKRRTIGCGALTLASVRDMTHGAQVFGERLLLSHYRSAATHSRKTGTTERNSGPPQREVLR